MKRKVKIHSRMTLNVIFAFIISLSILVSSPSFIYADDPAPQDSQASAIVNDFFINWLFTENHWVEFFIPGAEVEQRLQAIDVIRNLNELLFAAQNRPVLDEICRRLNLSETVSDPNDIRITEEVIKIIKTTIKNNLPNELIEIAGINLDTRKTSKIKHEKRKKIADAIRARFSNEIFVRIGMFINQALQLPQYTDQRHLKGSNRNKECAKSMVDAASLVFTAATLDSSLMPAAGGTTVDPSKSDEGQTEQAIESPSVIVKEKPPGYSSASLNSLVLKMLFPETGSGATGENPVWKEFFVYREESSHEVQQAGKMLRELIIQPLLGIKGKVVVAGEDGTTQLVAIKNVSSQIGLPTAQAVTTVISENVPVELTQAVSEKLYFQDAFETRGDPVRIFVNNNWERINAPSERPGPQNFRATLLEVTRSLVGRVCGNIERSVDSSGSHKFKQRNVYISLDGSLDGTGNRYVEQPKQAPLKTPKKSAEVEAVEEIARLESEVTKAIGDEKKWRRIDANYDRYFDSMSFEIRRVIGYLTVLDLMRTKWIPQPEGIGEKIGICVARSPYAAGTRAVMKIISQLSALGYKANMIEVQEMAPNKDMVKKGRDKAREIDPPFKVTHTKFDFTRDKHPSFKPKISAILDLSFLPYLPKETVRGGLDSRMAAMLQARTMHTPGWPVVINVDVGDLSAEYIKAMEKLGYVLEYRGPNRIPNDDVLMRMTEDYRAAGVYREKLDDSELFVFRLVNHDPPPKPADAKKIQIDLPEPVERSPENERAAATVVSPDLSGKLSLEGIPIDQFATADKAESLPDLNEVARLSVEGDHQELKRLVASEVLANWKDLFIGVVDLVEFYEGLIVTAREKGIGNTENARIEDIIASQLKGTYKSILDALGGAILSTSRQQFRSFIQASFSRYSCESGPYKRCCRLVSRS